MREAPQAWAALAAVSVGFNVVLLVLLVLDSRLIRRLRDRVEIQSEMIHGLSSIAGRKPGPPGVIGPAEKS